MNIINHHIFSPTIVPLTMEAFVAPADFDPNAQDCNIVLKFAAYLAIDPNAKYVFSVGTSATTALPAVSGRSYAYSQNDGAYTVISSGTITWTGGSTKRYVIVIDTASTITVILPLTAIWAYFSDKCSAIASVGENVLKYIHVQNRLSITELSTYCFYLSPNLTGILTIPNSITTIALDAFRGCSSLTSIVIPSSVTSIGEGAFQYCSSLTSITIPSSVVTIGNVTFQGCSSLTSAIIEGNNLTIINALFDSCTSLISVTMPASIVTIANWSFTNATLLNIINIRAIAPPTVYAQTFYGVNKSTCILHVPNQAGVLAAYQAAAYWNEFTNIIADL